MEVPSELFEVKEGRIEIAWCVLEDIKEEIKEELESYEARLSVIERYPFEGGMVVETIYLNNDRLLEEDDQP